MLRRNRFTSFALKSTLVALTLAASATTQAETGINDKEITWGNSSPLSGPNAGYGPIGRAQRACFQYINDELGGIKMGDGKTRKVKYVMYDRGGVAKLDSFLIFLSGFSAG